MSREQEESVEEPRPVDPRRAGTGSDLRQVAGNSSRPVSELDLRRVSHRGTTEAASKKWKMKKLLTKTIVRRPAVFTDDRSAENETLVDQIEQKITETTKREFLCSLCRLCGLTVHENPLDWACHFNVITVTGGLSECIITRNALVRANGADRGNGVSDLGFLRGLLFQNAENQRTVDQKGESAVQNAENMKLVDQTNSPPEAGQ